MPRFSGARRRDVVADCPHTETDCCRSATMPTSPMTRDLSRWHCVNFVIDGSVVFLLNVGMVGDEWQDRVLDDPAFGRNEKASVGANQSEAFKERPNGLYPRER